MTEVVLVAAGGAVGAVLRYLAVIVWVRHAVGPFPWATLAVNVAGSALLGVLVAGAAAGTVGAGTLALAGTGLCGALTTYSTFAAETLRLAGGEHRYQAVASVCVSVAAAAGAAAVGYALASAAWR